MKITKTKLKELLFTISIIILFVALVAALSFLLIPSLKIHINSEELLKAFQAILFVFICSVSVCLIYCNLKRSKKH
jgi:hypothetical protein